MGIMLSHTWLSGSVTAVPHAVYRLTGIFIGILLLDQTAVKSEILYANVKRTVKVPDRKFEAFGNACVKIHSLRPVKDDGNMKVACVNNFTQVI